METLPKAVIIHFIKWSYILFENYTVLELSPLVDYET